MTLCSDHFNPFLSSFQKIASRKSRRKYISTKNVVCTCAGLTVIFRAGLSYKGLRRAQQGRRSVQQEVCRTVRRPISNPKTASFLPQYKRNLSHNSPNGNVVFSQRNEHRYISIFTCLGNFYRTLTFVLLCLR